MKSMVPKIRFKGYTNFWEEKQLNTFVDRAVDNRGYTPQISQNGSYPLIEVACLGNINPDYSKVTKYLNEYTYNNCLRGYIKENDILFSTVGSIGLVSLMDKNEKACIAQNIVGFRAKEENVSNYIYSLLSTVNGKNVANQIVMSAVQPSVKVTQLLKCYYTITDNISEQSKIGSFFNYLDKIIVDIRIKLDKLKEIKKTMLYKMFPQNGKKVPEIRLKGFEGEWDNLQLKYIGDPYTSLSGKSKDDFGHGKAKYVTYMNVLLNPIADIKRTEKIEIDNTQNFVKKGDVFFTVSSETPEEVGMSSVWMFDEENMYLNSFCFGFRPKINIDYYFLAYAFRNEYFRKQMRFLAQGISRYNISKNKVMDLNIFVPKNMEEQKAIGEYFYKYDNMIDEYTQKITKLKELKKTLLKKMFV